MKLLLHPTTETQLTKLMQLMPGAYLLWGKEELGKFYTCKQILQVNNITPHVLSNTKSSIGIEDIKRIRNYLRLKSNETNDKQVVIINNADKMTPQAQNAFLKSVEELQENSILVLISKDIHHILPTIQSRCSMVHFSKVDTKSMRKYISDNYPQYLKDLDAILPFTDGSIGKAMNLLVNPSLIAEYSKVQRTIEKFISSSRLKKLHIATEVYNDENVESFIHRLIVEYTKITRAYVSSRKNADVLDTTKNVELCTNMLLYLKRNGNKKYALDLLAMSIV